MIEQIVEHFTYAGIFLVLFAAGLGVPIPEELPIAAAAALASQGVVRWWIALPVCIVAVVAGDVVLYWVGHHWGERILEWRLVRRILTKSRETKLLDGYRRHGVKIVFTARHIMGLRAAAFLTAGIAKFPFWKFLAVDGGAALVSVPIGFGLAHALTEQLYHLARDAHRWDRWLMLLGLLAAVGWLAYLLNRRMKKDRQIVEVLTEGGAGGPPPPSPML
jgi:membrane protein DedA with SNARE-associated domain